MVLLIPVVQEFQRELVAQRGMQSLPVVEDLNVLKGFSPHFGMHCIAKAMNTLVLEAIEPTLRRRVDAPMSSKVS